MPTVLITGTLGADIFIDSLPRTEITEDLLRAFRDRFEYELRYRLGFTSDLSIDINKPSRLRVDQHHEDARRLSISDLDRLLDKSVAQYLIERA